MSAKYIFQGLGGLVLLAAAWRFVGADLVQDMNRPAAPPAPTIKFQNDAPAAGLPPPEIQAAPRNIPMTVNGARKCRQKGRIVYTDRDCPPGTQEVDIERGGITVVKGQETLGQSAAKAKEAGQPLVRELAGMKPGEPTLKEQAAERAIKAATGGR
jgi:hypothetical protein